MEKFWCIQKNSNIDMMNGIKIPITLLPCLKSECDLWRDGEFGGTGTCPLLHRASALYFTS
jgi:hypothetical protein